MSVRSKILAHFKLVAREQRKRLAKLSEDAALLDLGLDSLCIAIVVARLEDELEVDPFDQMEDAEFPLTVGDFVRLYERAMAGDQRRPD